MRLKKFIAGSSKYHAAKNQKNKWNISLKADI